MTILGVPLEFNVEGFFLVVLERLSHWLNASKGFCEAECVEQTTTRRDGAASKKRNHWIGCVIGKILTNIGINTEPPALLSCLHYEGLLF